MTAKVTERDAILSRLDAIARELAAIRRALIMPNPTTLAKGTFTEKLLGCLGSESIKNYEYSLDWQRLVA